MLPSPGSELVLTRGSRRREEQNYVVGSTASIFSTLLCTGRFHQTGFIQTATLFLFSSSPLFSFPVVTLDFLSSPPKYSLFLHSSHLDWPSLFFPPVLLGHLTHNLFPYSSLLFHGPFQSELKLLHRWWMMVRLPLSLLCKEALTAIRAKEARKKQKVCRYKDSCEEWNRYVEARGEQEKVELAREGI